MNIIELVDGRIVVVPVTVADILSVIGGGKS